MGAKRKSGSTINQPTAKRVAPSRGGGSSDDDKPEKSAFKPTKFTTGTLGDREIMNRKDVRELVESIMQQHRSEIDTVVRKHTTDLIMIKRNAAAQAEELKILRKDTNVNELRCSLRYTGTTEDWQGRDLTDAMRWDTSNIKLNNVKISKHLLHLGLIGPEDLGIGPNGQVMQQQGTAFGETHTHGSQAAAAAQDGQDGEDGDEDMGEPDQEIEVADSDRGEEHEYDDEAVAETQLPADPFDEETE